VGTVNESINQCAQHESPILFLEFGLEGEVLQHILQRDDA